MYFFYRKTFSGDFTPMKSPVEPKDKTSDGHQLFESKGVTHLPINQHHLTLTQLSLLYPLQETV